jgi:drug/metabolite transporter (DMT)-like permease
LRFRLPDRVERVVPVELAIAGTVVTFGLYFWLLRHAAAHKLGLIANVTPAIALFLGWSLGEEPLTAFTLAGGALVLVGVLLVVGGKRKVSA